MMSIFENQHGKISQLDGENSLVLSFQSSEHKLKFCGFIALKSKIDKIDIVEMLLSDRPSDSLEVIQLCGSDRLMVLTLEEILSLKDLMAGAMVMMELNSIVHQRINRVLV